MRIRAKLLSIFLVSVGVLVVVLIGFLTAYLNMSAEDEEAMIRKDELVRVKQTLKNYVDIAYKTIESNYAAAQDKLYLERMYGTRLKSIVDLAVGSISENVKLAASGEISKEEAQKRSAEVVRKMRYDNGAGYLWINDIGEPLPKMVMHPIAASLNGKVMDNPKFNCALGRNENLFVAFRDVCLDKGDGYVDYLWAKPDKEGRFPKLSYVRLVKEWGWVIGTGIYVDDALLDAVEKSKEDLSKMRYDDGNGYFWINDVSKPFTKMVMHPIAPSLNGKILDNPKYNCALGKKKNLFSAFRDVCEESGDGYVDYLWSKANEEGEFPKLSYGRKFEPLGWIVGTGIYTDSIDEVVARKMVLVKAQIRDLNIMIVVTALVVSLISFVVVYVILTRVIIRPLQDASSTADDIALGDLGHTFTWDSKDEIGDLARSFQNMVSEIQLKASVVEAIASGDLTQSIDLASDQDKLGHSLEQMVMKLLTVITQIRDSATHIAGDSKHLFEGSDSLASRATEQAASIEQITSTMMEIGSQAKLNAEHAEEANKLARTAQEAAHGGNEEMREMVVAMNEIDESSREISAIIKTIDDIAFQTNLLALNAAVEAARAGQYGKGFAVVAEEVRALAQRSAKAANETTGLIEHAIGRVQKGKQLSDANALSLENISETISKVCGLISEITNASTEQAVGVEQISHGLDQIDGITQSNAANAEEMASSSKQLAEQSVGLKQIMEVFEIDEELACVARASTSATPQMVIDKVDQACKLLEKYGEAALPEFTGVSSPFIFCGTYVWIQKHSGTMLLHPMKPELNGQPIFDIKDTDNKKFLLEADNIATKYGSGWIDYMWPKPGKKKPSHKVSYVRAVNLGGEQCVVGCGVYDLADSEIKRLC